MNQRTNVAQSGTAFAAPRDIAWGYDTLGQVTSADSSENTLDRAYQYDAIGNRQKSADSLTLPVTHNYTSNAVNQYSAITGQPPGRTQDDDGNLTTGTIPADLTANSTLVWDAENRLVKITKPNGDVIDFDYDYMSRRISKKITGNEAKITVYDNWNPIAEYQLLNSNFILLTSFTWGMDLSGSIQGAGGVGGLLSVHQYGIDPNNQSPITNIYFPTFDGNGNVSEYLNNQGEVAAHYEYDPFGKTTVTTGLKAIEFTHRFSTKPLDVETELYYYGFRFYNPNTGRWESRDLIEEDGGVNLYGFVGNDGVNKRDYLGMFFDCDWSLHSHEFYMALLIDGMGKIQKDKAYDIGEMEYDIPKNLIEGAAELAGKIMKPAMGLGIGLAAGNKMLGIKIELECECSMCCNGDDEDFEKEILIKSINKGSWMRNGDIGWFDSNDPKNDPAPPKPQDDGEFYSNKIKVALAEMNQACEKHCK